jgi:hypothetical protein
MPDLEPVIAMDMMPSITKKRFSHGDGKDTTILQDIFFRSWNLSALNHAIIVPRFCETHGQTTVYTINITMWTWNVSGARIISQGRATPCFSYTLGSSFLKRPIPPRYEIGKATNAEEAKDQWNGIVNTISDSEAPFIVIKDAAFVPSSNEFQGSYAAVIRYSNGNWTEQPFTIRCPP